jgi:CBS domain containing-hemolysin-like protein
MTDADTLALLVMVLCLGGSMFFSGGETAITAFGEHRAEQLKEDGGSDGRVISQWVDQPVWVLSTILLGNNITNTLLGATATALAIEHLGGGPWGSYAVPIAVLVVTGVLLIFGEIVPKAMGRIYSRQLALPILRVLKFMGSLTYPVVWTLTWVTESVIGLAVDEDGAESKLTANELGYLVKVAQRDGTIRAEQAEMLQGVFRFEDRIVRDIMVPIDRVTAVAVDAGGEAIVEAAQRSGHSRLPVYAGDLDNIVGVLHIKQIAGEKFEELSAPRIHEIVRSPFFVSESLLMHDLLRRFKERRVHLAIVVDDAGDTVGVVTLEDVLEQIVGKIFDETDSAPMNMGERGAGLHYLDGQASLHRVEELIGTELEEMDGVDSIGDLLTRLAGQMPIAGSVFVWEQVRFKVLAADQKHISYVSVEQVELDDDDDD